MALKKRRAFEVFTLSFLDCICCGFGAVILFYTIISAQSSISRTRNNDDLTAQVNQLEVRGHVDKALRVTQQQVPAVEQARVEVAQHPATRGKVAVPTMQPSETSMSFTTAFVMPLMPQISAPLARTAALESSMRSIAGSSCWAMATVVAS